MTTSLFRLAGAQKMPGHFHTHVVPRPNPFSAQIQQHLLQLGSRSIDKVDYVAHCIATVKETLQLPEYDFSERGIKQVNPLLELFKEITGEASFMNEELLECTHTDFKQKFSQMLEGKWSCDAAHSFYPIPRISEKEEKITAAQLWTHNYFCALNELKQWQEPFLVTPAYIAQFLQKTSDHFHKYAHSVNEQKFKVMIDRMQKDPTSFQRIIEQVAEKAEKDPTSLSSLEKEYDDFIRMYVNYTMRHFPDIDKKVDLLRECVWTGFTHEKLKQPILGSPSLFVDIFKE